MANDWQSAYATRAAFLKAGIDAQNEKRRQAASDQNVLDNSATEAAFRRGNSYLSDLSSNQISDKKDGKSLVQSVLDALSTGTYIAQANVENAIESAKDATEGGGFDLGKYLDSGLKRTFSTRNPIIQGVASGFFDGEHTLSADNIANIQKAVGADPTSDESRIVQGGLGLVSDIALDPTWAIPAVPVAKIAGKGATGFVRGGARAKGIARDALERAGGDASSTIRKIAENEKGRVGTAIDYIKMSGDEWKASQAAMREAKAAAKTNGEGILTPDIAQVGGAADRIALSENEKAKAAAAAAKEEERKAVEAFAEEERQINKTTAELNAKAEEAQKVIEDSQKSAEDINADFLAQNEAIARRAQEIKDAEKGDVPLVEKPAAKKSKDPVTQAIKDTENKVSIAGDAAAKVDAINKASLKELEDFEPFFVAPRYVGPKFKKMREDLEQPPTIRRTKAAPGAVREAPVPAQGASSPGEDVVDWRGLAGELINTDPKKMIAKGERRQRQSVGKAILEEIAMHGSNKVGTPNSSALVSKDLIEKYTTKVGNTVAKDSDGMFKRLLSNEAEMGVVQDFVLAKGGMKIKGANGKPMSVNRLVPIIDNIVENTGGQRPIQEFQNIIKQNPGFFDDILAGRDPLDNSLKKDISKTPVDPNAPAQSDILDDFLKQEMEDIPNPKAWSPEKEAAYIKAGLLDPLHSGKSPEEIMGATRQMSDAQIKKWIMDEDNRTTKQLQKLQRITGETDMAKIADKFVQLRKWYFSKDPAAPFPGAKVIEGEKAGNKIIENGEKVVTTGDGEKKLTVKQQREARKPREATEEEIDLVNAHTAQLADEFIKSPQALDDALQKQFRLEKFVEARNTANPELEGIVTNAKLNEHAENAVRKALDIQLKPGRYKTDGGFNTMEEGIDKGGAWRPDLWGTNSQQTLHSEIRNAAASITNAEAKRVFDMNKAAKSAGSKEKVGFSYVVTYRRVYMDILKKADAQLRSLGVDPWLNHVNNSTKKVLGPKGISHPTNLSWYDILSGMERAGQIDMVQKIINGQHAFNQTQVSGAIEAMLRFRAEGLSEGALRGKVISQLRKDESLEYGRPVSNEKRAGTFEDSRITTIQTRNDKVTNKEEASLVREKQRQELTKAILDPRLYAELSTQRLINTAQHSARIGENVKMLADDTVRGLHDMKEMPPADQVKYLADQIKEVKNKFPQADWDEATKLFNAQMDKVTSSSLTRKFVTNIENRIGKLKDKEVIKEVPEKTGPLADKTPVAESSAARDKVNKSMVEDAKASQEQAIKDAPDDAEYFEAINAAISIDALRRIHPVQAFFNPRLGLGADAFRAMNSGLHSVARQQNEFHSSLMSHISKYPAAITREDFSTIQKAVADKRNFDEGIFKPESLRESAQELYGIVGVIMNTSLRNVWARNAVGTAHFNTLAKANGLHPSWRFRDMDPDPVKNAYLNSHLWATEWEGIDKLGILDFLSKMHSIAIKSAQDISIAASFAEKFGSSVPKEGFAKISLKNVAKDDPALFKLLPQDMYYPKDILVELHRVDRMMHESRHISPKNAWGKFIVNVFDPVTNALKASQTTVRPGHWVLSVVGNTLQNQLAGVHTFMPYKHAGSIMVAGKKLMDKSVDDGDMLQFAYNLSHGKAISHYNKTQQINSGFMASGSGEGMQMLVGGRKVHVSYEDLYRMFSDTVMLPPHRGGGVMEDRLIDSTPTAKFAKGIENATDFVTDNKKFNLNKAAAVRDNWARVALAVDYVSKRAWKNLDEMKAAAEDVVTKWYPTSTDMTAAEAKTLRRTILYYTWLRGITPRVLDAAMTRPGVATAIPKALYNMAYANGLDPESIGQPFPEDHMFPSYYKNNVLGPQWKTEDGGMWGFNPSSPVIEVANTFNRIDPTDLGGTAEGIISQLGSMATPFARIPAELATGTQAGSGIPIEDRAQYLLDNLGGSWTSALSRATGKTVGIHGIVDRTDSAAKYSPEEQSKHAALQGINFLTGGKLTDYNSVAAQKAAAYDQREKYKKQAELDARRD